MIKACKIKFHATKQVINKLFKCNRISGQIWNDTLALARDYNKQHGKWITRNELHRASKGKYPIHSQSIQAVYEKYLQARENARKARLEGHSHIRYPYKQKKHFNTTWKKDGFKVHPNGKIELKLGIWERKRQQPLVVHVDKLPAGEIKEIELTYDRGLMLAISYEDGTLPKKSTGTHMAAIDPGEIHSITAVCENGQGIMITGRKLRSIKRLRNKKLKELQKKMSRCKKSSRRWKKYQRALNYIISKSEAQLRDALHKTTRAFVDWCIDNQIKDVVVGDVEGVQRNTSPKKKNNKKKRTHQHNQRMSQWEFGKQYKYLEYKLAAEGITIRKKDEAYTTQTCPVCGRRKKPSGRMYACYCGYREHRDIHGSKNLLTLEKYGEFKDFLVKQVKYLRVA